MSWWWHPRSNYINLNWPNVFWHEKTLTYVRATTDTHTILKLVVTHVWCVRWVISATASPVMSAQRCSFKPPTWQCYKAGECLPAISPMLLIAPISPQTARQWNWSLNVAAASPCIISLLSFLRDELVHSDRKCGKIRAQEIIYTDDVLKSDDKVCQCLQMTCIMCVPELLCWNRVKILHQSQKLTVMWLNECSW